MVAAYRIRQGLRALFAFTQSLDDTPARAYLSSQQLVLFKQMQRSEQAHGLNVLRDVLRQQETTPDDLAVAALLHDVGKIRYPLPVWSKTFGVLVRVLAPGLFRRWRTGSPANPFARACVVMTQHPGWGGELAAKVGASERAAWLIAHHDSPPHLWRGHPHYTLLERLYRADNAN